MCYFVKKKKKIMPDIYVPYSLARQDMLSFKEIDCTLFLQLQSAMHALADLDRERAPSFESLYNEAAYRCVNISKRANKYAKRYEFAARAYEEFKKMHAKILLKGEMISDPDCTPKLSWILFNIDREKAFARHQKRYKDIYQRLSELSQEVQKYVLYSPERKLDTITEESYRQKQYCQSWAENQIEARDKAHHKKRSVLLANLSVARYFLYLIRDLRIETNGNICTISGEKDLLRGSKGFTKFNQTLINKSITLSR